jgi:serine/threonine-protein kinase
MYDIEDPTTRSDLWYLTVYDGGDHYEATPYLHSPAAEYGGKFSPDGQFVAYVSDKSGTPEVYIRRFPDDGALPRQISENGGAQPVWARNGKRLFFLEGDMLVSVAISTKPQLSVGERHRLFKSPLDVGYVVSANGERVLSGEPWGTVPPPFIRIVENWFAEFRDGMKARY